MNSAPTPAFHFSLREFLLLFTAIFVGCAAMKFANQWWLAVISAAALVALMTAIIRMLLDRGPRQAFAIGFLACLLTYAAALVSQQRVQLVGFTGGSGERYPKPFNPEMDLSPAVDASLFTTILLKPLYQSIAVMWFRDTETFRRFRFEELPSGTTLLDVGISDEKRKEMGSIPLDPSVKPPTKVRYTGVAPDETHFIRIGHLLWALVFGYVGGHFSRFVYARRIREQSDRSSLASSTLHN